MPDSDHLVAGQEVRSWAGIALLAICVVVLLLVSSCAAQGLPHAQQVPQAAPVFEKPRIGDCYSYEVVEATLWELGETTQGRYRTANGSASELFIGAAGSTLSTVEIMPGGLACYRGFGGGWGAQPRNMTPG